ncbi:MAG: Clp protease N-terminal domain-containing protein [Nitrosotalea sp.]
MAAEWDRIVQGIYLDQRPLSEEEVRLLPDLPADFFLNHPLGDFTNALLRDLIAARKIADEIDHVPTIPDAGHGDGVTPEYMLLGLLRSNDTSAAQALRALGKEPSTITDEMKTAMKGRIPLSSTQYIGNLTPHSVTVLGDAFSLAGSLNSPQLTGAHVLAVIAGSAGLATSVLRSSGVTAEGIRSVVSGTPR